MIRQLQLQQQALRKEKNEETGKEKTTSFGLISMQASTVCSCIFAGDQTQGCYLLPKDANRFVDVARSFKVFAVHPSPPYIRQCLTTSYASLKDLQVGRQFGWPAFLKTTKKAYPAKYMGPFILGIRWQAPEKGRQVPDMQWLFT